MAKGVLITLAFLIMLMMGACVPEQVKKVEETKTVSEMKEKEKAVAEAEAKRAAEEKVKAEKEEQERQAASKKEQEEMAKTLDLELVIISRVIDGDTLETSDGRKIRLVGVNTPESTTRSEEYGKEASNYTAAKLKGKQVWIEKDVSETDRYGRLLRIVWLSVPTNDLDEAEIRSKMFNADLVLNGYAEPSTYPPDVKYSEYFVKFAREAREANKGLLAYGEQGTTKGDLDAAQQPSNNSGASSAGGNTADGSANTKGESFKNCTEMRKVYPKGVPSTHPAYEPRHDRDKDDWACER